MNKIRKDNDEAIVNVKIKGSMQKAAAIYAGANNIRRAEAYAKFMELGKEVAMKEVAEKLAN